MFKKILIANRGEIAVRIIAAARELGIKTVAIFSDVDAQARHVELADEHWRLKGEPVRTYLDGAQIVDIAKQAGVDAIHPGYGFLSENADFAQACLDAGIKFIGPKPQVIRRMGSKVEARRAMQAAGVPVVPGTTDPVTDSGTVQKLATKYGYPIAIKASAGGGGRGLKVITTESQVESALASAQREGTSYFGSGEVYVEKYLDVARHIEVQIIGDEHGNIIHLGERDCSSQRRHQKLLEETPAAKLDKDVRTKLLDAAVAGAKALQYSSAGTMEFLVSGKDFYFLEVNTRVQVEHPITEMVTGVDIVKEQILVADNEKLSLSQKDVEFRGHAIEFRINAEDASKNFMPNPGTITRYCEPRMPWVRVDSACYEGYQILPFYDSLIAKLVVWGRTRQEAIVRGKTALASFVIEGVNTTIPFQIALLNDAKFRAGEMNTKYVESELIKTFMAAHANKPAAQGSASEKRALSEPTNNGHHAQKNVRTFDVEVNQKVYKVTVSEKLSTENSTASAQSGSKAPLRERPRSANSDSVVLSNDRSSLRPTRATDQLFDVRSSMNGLVKAVFVAEGETVTQGQKLFLFEAMKMESEISADKSGIVTTIKVKAGAVVDSNTSLLTISSS